MDLSFVAVGTTRRWTNLPKQNPTAAAIRNFQSGKFTSGYFKHRSWKYSAIIDAIGRRANQQMVAQSKAHRRRTCAHLDRTEAEHGPLARPIGGKAPLPEFTKYQISGLLEGVKYDPKDVPEGTAIYVAACATCHGVPASTRAATSRNSVMSRPRRLRT